MNRLQDKIALITGGSRGIGLAMATRFAEEGADLFLCATNPDRLEEAASELRQLGGRVAWGPADVSDRQAVFNMVETALAEFGRIDILVNNAGAYQAARFVDYTPEDFDRIMKINLYGVFNVTQAVLPGMMERKKGKIVNIASTAGKWGSRNQSAYNASKHAVIGLTRCLGLEAAPLGINVNAICPALVESEMSAPMFAEHARMLGIPEDVLRQHLISQIPMQRLLKPGDVADLAVYLASEESNNVTCQSLAVCGGYTMI